MRKINLSEFLYALEYHSVKCPHSPESLYLKSLLGEEDGCAIFSGTLFTDEEAIYSKDEYDHKSWLHVADIDWSKKN
jgi:hypothetical protein